MYFIEKQVIIGISWRNPYRASLHSLIIWLHLSLEWEFFRHPDNSVEWLLTCLRSSTPNFNITLQQLQHPWKLEFLKATLSSQLLHCHCFVLENQNRKTWYFRDVQVPLIYAMAWLLHAEGQVLSNSSIKRCCSPSGLVSYCMYSFVGSVFMVT